MFKEAIMKKSANSHLPNHRCPDAYVPLRRPNVVSVCFLFILFCAGLIGLSAKPANAGFLGHNGLGDFGLQSGTQPDPGLSLSFMYLRYDSDTLRNRDGERVSLDPNDPSKIVLNADDPDSIDVNGYAAGIYYVTDYKIWGANYGFMIFPGFTSNKLEAPILGLVQETDFGLTDTYVQPVNLGWHTSWADVVAGLGVYVPTGSYDPDASDNLGLGMWSFEFSAGATIYFDKAKTWHFATTAFYEIHTEKKTPTSGSATS
jgi:hypothetical protein